MKKILLLFCLSFTANFTYSQDSRKIATYLKKPNNINNGDLQSRVVTAVNTAFSDCGYLVRFNAEWEDIPQNPSGATAIETEALHIIYKAACGFLKEFNPHEKMLMDSLRKNIAAGTILFVELTRNLSNKDQEYEIRIHMYKILTNEYLASPIVVYFTEKEVEHIERVAEKVREALFLKGRCLSDFRPRSSNDKDMLKWKIRLLIRLHYLLPNDKRIQDEIRKIRGHPKTNAMYLDVEMEIAETNFLNHLFEEEIEMAITWLDRAIWICSQLCKAFSEDIEKKESYENMLFDLKESRKMLRS